MVNLSHFHGGLTLRHHKKVSCEHEVVDAGIPDLLYLNLRSSRGHDAEPLFEPGTQVHKGQLIARPKHERGVWVHAPTSGVIQGVEQQPTPTPDANLAPVLILKPDHKDMPLSPEQPAQTTASDNIVQAIQAAGISGMGGAGFPTHVKYQVEQAAQTLIINGAECEPYISCDERLMLNEPMGIVLGTDLLMRAAKATHAIIAIEDNMSQVEDELNAAIKKAELTQIQVVCVPTIYPTGGEKQLIKVLTGQEVPSKQSPLSLGLVMQNVATAKAVADALINHKPLTERLITVTGDGVNKPGNYRTLIGTPLRHLLKKAEVDLSQINKLIMGGPMMGYAMPSDEIGIDKSSNCLLVLNEGSTKPELEAMPCIRCGDCVKVCPQELLPQQLFWYINGNDQGNDLEKARAHHVFDCIECGACAWVCPSHINLVDYYRFAKSELTYLDHKQSKANTAKQRHDDRLDRLERIKAERQAKRRAKTSRLFDKKVAKKEISAVLARIKQKNQEGADD